MGTKTGSGKVEVVKTGSRATISGYACQEYVLQDGTRSRHSIWTTSEVRGFDRMAKDFGQFMRILTAMDPAQGSAIADALKSLRGFPIRTVTGGASTTVTRVEARDTPTANFSAPEGYRRVDSPLLRDNGEKP